MSQSIRPLYFAYGSNMLKSRIEHRVGKVLNKGNFILKDYELCFNCGIYNQSFANIKPSKGNEVEGVLYELDELQIGQLDLYENYPRNYEKRYFLDKNQLVFAYVSVNKYFKADNNALPHLAYINLLLDGAMENGLKTTYNQLVAFKNKNYQLKKGSKHKPL